MEPLEIERAIASLDGIKEAAVTTLTRCKFHQYLAAFLTIDSPDAGPKISSFRSTLADMLPPLMIPTHVEIVAELPSLSNGKLDRRALRRGLGNLPLVHTPKIVFSSSLSQTLEKLAPIWGDVLELGPDPLNSGILGPESDFKMMGGNSFALLKLVFRCANVWERPIDIPSFLAKPTLAAMALQIQQANRGKMSSEIFIHADVLLAPLSPSQLRLLDGIKISSPQIRHHNIEFLYEVSEGLEKTSEALRCFLERHDVFRISSLAIDEHEQIVQNFGGTVPAPLIDSSDTFDKFVESAKSCRGKIDLKDGRLHFFHLWSEDTGVTYLYGLLNHLIFDGYSQFLMLSELSALIEDPKHVLPTPLGFGARSITYREQEAYAAFQKEIPYWSSVVGEVTVGNALSDLSGDDCEGVCKTVPTILKKPEMFNMQSEQFRSSVVLAVCIFSVGTHFKKNKLDVRVVGSTRLAIEAIDDSLTVGYISDHYPQRLIVGDTLVDTINNVLNAGSALPRGGAGYGWLRHAFKVPPLLEGAQIEDFPIHFNYLPRSDNFPLFTDCTERLGSPDPYLGDKEYRGIGFFVSECDGSLEIGVYRNTRFISENSVQAVIKGLEKGFNELSRMPQFVDISSSGQTTKNVGSKT